MQFNSTTDEIHSSFMIYNLITFLGEIEYIARV